MKLNDRFVFTMVMALLMLDGPGAAFRVSAQQKPPAQPKCPAVNVTCPSEVFVKNTLKFTAEVRGGDSKVTPTYNWTVSAGSIESGQGTTTIDVSTSEVEGGSTVTATVELGGFDRDCGYGSSTSSCTSAVMKKAEARKLDEYGKLTPKEEEAKLDNFIIELNLDPTAQGYIISYNARTNRPGDAQKAADRASIYLIKKRGLELHRIVTVTGSSREQPTVELWIVPAGAQPPKPTPTVKPS
ncbi:MAG TPA: hypothetical protein VI837_11470 [Blastocatellia bacterium]|nr:hypothetical protein [Blastocatellia bacterium]